MRILRRWDGGGGRQQDWRAVMVIAMSAFFLDVMAWGHLQAFTPIYLQDVLQVPPADVPRWVGLLASSSMIIATPLSIFWGVLADRYSRKWMILRGEFLAVLAYGLVAVADNVWGVLAAHFLFGFCFGTAALIIATQSMVTPERKIGLAISIVQMSGPIAMSIGPIVGSLLIKLIGMRAMFGLDAALAFSSGLLILIFLREPPGRADPRLSIGRRLRIVLAQVTTAPPVRWNFVVAFLASAGMTAAQPYIPVAIERASRSAGVDAVTAIGVILGSVALLSATAMPILGRLADRVGAARIVVVAAPILALVFFGLSWATSLTLVAALVLLRALPQAGTNSPLTIHLAAIVPAEHRSAIMSLSPAPRNFAMLISPALASLVSGFGLGAVFQYAALCLALATGAALVLNRVTAPPPPESARNLPLASA
ncbi:MAG: MFS transporter [Chloroflexi bacterium]|nr:MFS transporter [Chloroflexota bacterium]